MRVNAYAAPAAGQPLAPTTIERRDVGPNDVLIEIQYAGICHSDIHTVNGDWGPQPFPVVPGHEIVGIVAEVGADVTRHKVGDRVGVGCLVNSCGHCTNCQGGDDADDFVAGHDREGLRAPVAVDGVDVGVADAGVLDFDEDVVGADVAALDGRGDQRLAGFGGGVRVDTHGSTSLLLWWSQWW